MTSNRTARTIQCLWFPALSVLLGCSLIGTGAGSIPATQTALAFSVMRYSTSAGGRFPPPTNTLPGIRPATPTATATVAPPATPTPTATGTAAATLTATIAHTATPPETAGTTGYIVDPETRPYAPEQRAPAGSDVYQNNRYERPYSSGTMEYLSDVDLTRVELRIAPPWIVVTFRIAEPRAEGIGRTMYGAEFDTDLDGRGDYLVWGASPAGADWTVEGVEIWNDSDGDVGGANPQMTNAPYTGGDGYDRKVFSGGGGADPDLAWIRRSEDGAKIQLAFKGIAIKNSMHFLWNGLADFGVRRPDWFDYNDHFTQADAGSPLPIQPDFYPLKSLWGIDNTCLAAYGFTATGAETGLC
jgi:hypothetical protein